MKKIRKKKQLEIAIDSIERHPNPKVELEQYSTPSTIASDLLWNAYTLGDIENKDIVDLGCGCGIFATSSMLLGANSAVGVDIDQESIDVARACADKFNIKNIKFIVNDVADIDYTSKIDTIFQNPPFGSQKRAEKGADLEFLQAALRLKQSVIYSFHMASTFDFLLDCYKEIELSITHGFKYKFPIPKIYEFHEKELKFVDVVVFRAEL
ncbi:MAG: METTL5 family protein [archaeon]|nr:METTL5 family protein [archaeon]